MAKVKRKCANCVSAKGQTCTNPVVRRQQQVKVDGKLFLFAYDRNHTTKCLEFDPKKQS